MYNRWTNGNRGGAAFLFRRGGGSGVHRHCGASPPARSALTVWLHNTFTIRSQYMHPANILCIVNVCKSWRFQSKRDVQKLMKSLLLCPNRVISHSNQILNINETTLHYQSVINTSQMHIIYMYIRRWQTYLYNQSITSVRGLEDKQIF